MSNKLRSVVLLLSVAVAYACADAPTQATSDIENQVKRSQTSSPGDCGVYVSIAKTWITVGESVSATVEYEDCDTHIRYLAGGGGWSSDNNRISLSNLSGYATSVTGATVGATAITGSVGSGYDRIELTVCSGTVTNMTSSPSSIAGNTGTTHQLSITRKDECGLTISSGSVSYSSSNTGVATVSSGGLVSLIAPGSATITASSGSASVNISVSATGVLSTPTISASVTGSGYGRLDWTAVPGATAYDVYIGDWRTQCFDDWGCFEFSNGGAVVTVYTNSFEDQRSFYMVLNPGDPRGYWSDYKVVAKNPGNYTPSGNSNLVMIGWN